jgi:hypothetical protein
VYTIWGKDLILPTLMSYEHTFDFFPGVACSGFTGRASDLKHY